MPHETSTKDTRASRARRFLATGGVTREDSDDELGLEDHPWEWIYAVGPKPGSQYISGAKFGQYQFKMGDTVLLKAEGSNEAWVGIICDFQEVEEEGEKTANFMWFSGEQEIRNKQKKRMDFLPVSSREGLSIGRGKMIVDSRIE